MKFILYTALVIGLLSALYAYIRQKGPAITGISTSTNNSAVVSEESYLESMSAKSVLELRPFNKLGSAFHGWLDTKFHFSFADYYDPRRMNWGALRVWNDDIIEAHNGFDPHPHRDMEIITYVYEGAITHQDTMGNKGRTAAGDVQVMAAGTGVYHSEYNLEDERTRLFQLWIMPNQRGRKPSWGNRKFPKQDRSGKFVVLASGFEKDYNSKDENAALEIHTDSRVLGATIEKDQVVEYELGARRMGYLVPAKGSLDVNGVTVNAHDGLAIKDTDKLTIKGLEDCEVVLVDTISV